MGQAAALRAGVGAPLPRGRARRRGPDHHDRARGAGSGGVHCSALSGRTRRGFV